MIRKTNRLAGLVGAVAAVLLLSTGCASTAKFDYAQASVVKYRSAMTRTLPAITVVPFTDARPVQMLEKHFSEQAPRPDRPKELRGVQGTFATGWIPLMPYAWMSTELPEEKNTILATLRNFWCNFDRELAEAAGDSLREAGCFRDVYCEDDLSKVKTRYAFLGTIHSTKYEGIRITYGVTYLAAPVLWLLGLPEALSKNTLEVSFQILDLQTNQIIWKYRFDGSNSILHGLYYNVGRDTAHYPTLMKLAVNAALYQFENEVIEAKKR